MLRGELREIAVLYLQLLMYQDQRFSLKIILLKTNQLRQVGNNIFPANFVFDETQRGLSPNLLVFSMLFSRIVLFFAMRGELVAHGFFIDAKIHVIYLITKYLTCIFT